MKNTKVYRLSSFSSDQIYLFQRRVTEAMRPQLLDIVDEDTFIYKALSHIDLPVKSRDPESKARQVIVHFLGEGVYKDYRSILLERILGVREIPYRIAKRIENAVKNDLQEINALIQHYQSHDYIKRLIKKDESPRNHEEKILHDFYKRCLIERENILEYLLSERIGNMAIAGMYVLEGTMIKFAEFGRRLRQRPYQFANVFKEPYFDYRKIDDFWHRVKVFPMADEDAAFKLYKADKNRFYRKFFKKYSVADVFKYILKYLDQLPISEGRIPVFQELEKLFRAKLFIGFYALALSQIEGIFGEMITVISENPDSPRSALPDKVEKMRQYHDMSDYFFDYFQYEIPRLRNKFAHSGYDQDLQIKSYDLMLDLAHLLKLFDELKHPLVKIRRIYQHPDVKDFSNFKDFARYFQLLEGLLPGQRKAMEAFICQFEREFICEETDIDFICREVSQSFPPLFEQLKANVSSKVFTAKGQFDFGLVQPKEMKKLLSEESFQLELASAMENESRNTFQLSLYGLFFQGYQKYLPSLNQESKKLLDDIYHKQKTAIANFLTGYRELLDSGKLMDWNG